MLMKNIIITLALIINCSYVFASDKIEEAVNTLNPLAQSGIQVLKVNPTMSVKTALLELAFQTGYISEESEFSWQGTSPSAWEVDSSNWGEATFKDAYEYITYLDKDYVDYLNDAGNEVEKANVYKAIETAKDTFKTLQETGVLFGVAPMGAVQCGVTFAALTIIDPVTGKIYIVSKEGSGC
jgi:hypothetical protein